ncbi:MAG: uridine kinase [Bacteroidota bacterium]
MQPYLVGICGGSGSGKTYLLEKIKSRLPEDQITIISQDNYYLPYEKQEKDAEGLVNFDHPKSVNLDQLYLDVQKLLRGEAYDLKEYTFNNPAASARTFHIKPAPIIILEGIFVYHHINLRKTINLKLFVEADEHIRLIRRIRRDYEERGYSFDSVARDYERFVAPMYHQFIGPMRSICDLIIPNNTALDTACEVVIHHLERELARS